MKMWKKCGSGLALLASLTPTLRAQIPPAPAPAPATLAPIGPTRNLWSFLCPTPEQKLACKDKICNCKLGQMFNNGLKPIGALSGGLFGPFCPGYTQDDLKKPPDSAEGAAARIKKDEAEAKARRAAIRYLGTVDCHYWPEAQDALINGLRGDRNECVRLEAALALGSGCCCTRKTIEALSITVSGSEADGNAFETSERVKAVALGALEHCLARLAGPPLPVEHPAATPTPREELPAPKETPPAEKAPGKTASAATDPLAYYRNLDQVPMSQIIEKARRAVAQCNVALKPGELLANAGPAGVSAAGASASDAGLLGLLNKLMKTPSPASGNSEADPKSAATPTADKPRTVSPASPLPPQGEIKPTAYPPAPNPASGSVPTPPASPYLMRVPPPAPTPPVATNPKPQTAQPASSTSAAKPATPPAPAPAPAAIVRVVSVTPPAAGIPVQERQPLPTPPPTHCLSGGEVAQALRALRDGITPEEREWAAANLAMANWQTEPQVVDSLVAVARRDPAATVRVVCIRSLARLGVNTVPVITTLQALKSDVDPRVHREAGLALDRLTGGLMK